MKKIKKLLIDKVYPLVLQSKGLKLLIILFVENKISKTANTYIIIKLMTSVTIDDKF